MARQHLDELFELAVELSSATTRQEVARVVVGRGTHAMRADTCTLYALDENDGSLELIGDGGVAPQVLQQIRRLDKDSGNLSFTMLRSGQPIWGESDADLKNLYPSIASIPAEGPRAHAFWSTPLIVENKPIGLLGMGFYQPRRFSDEDRSFVGTFSGYCAQALRRAQRLENEQRTRKEAEHAQTRRAFVAEATTALASSLDYQATLTRLAELFIPRLADWCSVDILDGAGKKTWRQVALTHVDPDKVKLARALVEKYPRRPDELIGVPNVLRTGRSELYPNITDAMLATTARDAGHLAILRDLQLTSAMIVPLVARGQTLGAITAVYAESGRHYGADDLSLVEDLAGRAAIAIDNAQLYASEHEARLAADVANRTKDDFLASVSHELRTPLNAILGWARIMNDARSDERRRARASEIIERNAAAMARLIEDLLDVSRIMTGRARLDVGPVVVDRLIQVVVDSVRPTLDAKQIELHRSAAAGGHAITADAERLQQVIGNLLGNAIKFTPNRGRIDIRSWQTETASVIEVSDTGKGIVPEFLPHVFDPFRQADGSITRVHGGLGLGLAISRHLVELHGGEIRVQSAGEGRGATFTVTLPLVLATRAEAMRLSGAGGGGGGGGEGPRDASARVRGLRVLAVDDDTDARQLIQTILEDSGAHVRTASSVAEAMIAIQSDVPDVLLSDIGMPDQDGYALIRQVRALPVARGGGVPAAAITAYTRSEDRELVLRAGYTMHIPKPIEPAALLAVVASLAEVARRGPAGIG